MKNWKKQWKIELDSVIPDLDEKVLNEPIPVNERVESIKITKKPFFKKGVFAGVLSFCAVLVLTVAVALSGIIPTTGQLGAGTGNGNNGNGSSSSAGTGDSDSEDGGGVGGGEVTSSFKSALATVEINPIVTFVLNESGYVTNVLAGNTDADVILSNSKNELMNKELKVAIKNFVDISAKLGFLDVNGTDAVRVSSVGDVEDAWMNGVKDELYSYFDDNNIKSALISEKVDFDKFSERCNLGEFDDVEDLYDWAKDKNELFTYRQMAGKSNAEWSEFFNTEILNGMFKDELLDEIADYVEEVTELSVLINNCPDYWEKKDTGIGDETVDEITDILADLLDDYGVEINNMMDYSKFAQKFLDINIDEFKDEITGLLSQGKIADVKTKVKELGIITFEDFSDVEDLISNPQAVVQFINDTFNKKHDNMKKDNEDKLSEVREEISYEDFMQGVQDEIENDFAGSLDDFFDNHKKGQNPPQEGECEHPDGGNGED